MEIYNLKNYEDIRNKSLGKPASDSIRKTQGAHGGKVSKQIVTDLKQAVRNPERVNVYIDEKFAFSLDIAQVVDFHLKIGKGLTNDELDELKKASEFGKLYQRTLEWVLMRPHSEKECRDYLKRKLRMSSLDTFSRARLHGARSLLVAPAGATKSPEDNSEFLNAIIKRLVNKGYVDDRKFAEWYVENRFLKKGVSLKRLTMELAKKGISKEVIEEALDKSGRNDVEEIRKMITKKRVKYPDDQKLIGYLVRQGFDYQAVKTIVEESRETED